MSRPRESHHGRAVLLVHVRWRDAEAGDSQGKGAHPTPRAMRYDWVHSFRVTRRHCFMPKPPKKTLMRNLGEFFGHIARGVKTDPAATQSGSAGMQKQVARKTVEEEKQGNVVLRRTTIEEIEVRNDTGND